MSFRRQCTVQATSCFVFGTVLLAAPWLILGVLGAPDSAHIALVARLLGGILWALGAMLVAARDTVDDALCARIAAGNALADLVIGGFVAKATAEGTLGPMGWLLTATFALNVVTWMLARPRL